MGLSFCVRGMTDDHRVSDHQVTKDHADVLAVAVQLLATGRRKRAARRTAPAPVPARHAPQTSVATSGSLTLLAHMRLPRRLQRISPQSPHKGIQIGRILHSGQPGLGSLQAGSGIQTVGLVGIVAQV